MTVQRNGEVYTLTFDFTDDAGNAITGTCTATFNMTVTYNPPEPLWEAAVRMTAVWYSAAPLFARRGARRAYPAGKERRIFRERLCELFP